MSEHQTKTLHELQEWALSAEPGDYLAEFEDDGMTAEDDPGNRCGYRDDDLALVEAWLAERGLTLATDDVGLACAETSEMLGPVDVAMLWTCRVLFHERAALRAALSRVVGGPEVFVPPAPVEE